MSSTLPSSWTGSALIRTSFSSSSSESWSSLAKVGTSVSNLSEVASPSGSLTSFLNSPVTVSPLEEISLTLSLRTWSRKKGL